MTEKPDSDLEPSEDEAPEEPGETLTDSAPVGAEQKWGLRTVVAVAAGAGLVASGVWMSETFGGDGTELRDQAARIQGLETERAILRGALTETEAELAALAQRLDAIGDTLAAVIDAVDGAVPRANFDVLATQVDARLAALDAARGDPQFQAENAAALADLSDRVTALEPFWARLEALEALAQTVADGAQNDGNPAAAVTAPSPVLTARLAELEQALAGLAAALAAALPTGAVMPDLAAMETRIGALEAEVRAIGPGAASRGSASALVLAAQQLRDRLQRAGPFQAELTSVRQVAAARQVVDRELQSGMNRLGDFAATGAPTTDQLTGEFVNLASQIVAATEPGGGWAAGLWDRMRGVISVRRTGEVAGDDAEARVARAEVRLGVRDLQGAIAELNGLDGAAAAAVRSWLDRARDRATVDEAAALIATRAVALLAQEFGNER